MKRLTSLLLIVVMALVAITFVGPSAVSAKSVSRHAASLPLCNSESTCDGKLPWDVVAPDGHDCLYSTKFLQQVSLPGAGYYVLNLYYSNNCQTNYAEVDSTSKSPPTFSIANANITRQSDGRYYQSTWTNNDYVDSPMVFSPVSPAKACGSVNNNPGNCTSWI